jgi:uncharacterized protein
MLLLLLAAGLLLSLFLIPLGLPGLWLMLGIGLLYDVLEPTRAIGTGAIVGAALLVLVAEGIEFVLGGRYARKYGGSRRAGWGAILGGLVGAVIGFPIPILGPMIGGFIGAFVGALGAEMTVRSDTRAATRAATGAVVGRAVAVALKVAVGTALAAWFFAAALT